MVDDAQRRSEIAAEISRLCEQQREALQDATFLGSHIRRDGYTERAQRIGELLSQLVTLDEAQSVRGD